MVCCFVNDKDKEPEGQGAGSRGELEITLNFRLLNNLSSSPLHLFL
ncbi:hypothetical protein NSP_28810 [Nodularia spumigena CCY9414]|nr:hypothetical protein NSP_28810 [Nodularia spumigena CCY9414]